MSFKDYLEMAYFIASILIAIMAFFGLNQIKVMREIASSQAERDAIKLSSKLCADYLVEIVPIINKLDKSFNENDIDLNNYFKVKGEGDDQEVFAIKDMKEEFTEKYIKSSCLENFLSYRNHIEVFSLHFMSRVADEQIAYSTIGSSFLFSADKYLPLLLILQDKENSKDNKSNAVKLFYLWSERRKAYGLHKESLIIKEKLKQTKDEYKTPIGVYK